MITSLIYIKARFKDLKNVLQKLRKPVKVKSGISRPLKKPDFIITLRDTTGVCKELEMLYKIRKSNLGQLWKEHLHSNFIAVANPIEKNYCLQGWQTDWDTAYPRDLTHICKRLNYHIAIVNREMPSHGYPVINLHFSKQALIDDAQDALLNKIHHHFELLIGQSWNPSKWWKLSLQNKTRFSIRMLNNYCHEIEGIIASIRSPENRPWLCISLSGIGKSGFSSKNKKRSNLLYKHYLDFTDESSFGNISLFYAQLGKQHIEVYDDNDTDIERENISGIRYVTGEFIINYHRHPPRLQDQEYVQWLTDNNWNINDPTLALTTGVVADLQNNMSEAALKKELLKRDDVYKFTLDGQSRVYNYTWKDQEGWEDILYKEQ